MTALSLRRPSYAPLFARGGVFAKDIIQYAPFAFGLGALLLGYMGYRALMAAAGVHGAYRVTGEEAGRMLTGVLLGTVWGMGLVATCDEEESETGNFLGRLPLGPGRLLWGKIAAVAVTIAAWLIVLLPLSWLLIRPEERGFLEYLTDSVVPTTAHEIAGFLFVLVMCGLTGMLAGALFVRRVAVAMLASGAAALLVTILARNADVAMHAAEGASWGGVRVFSLVGVGLVIHAAWTGLMLWGLHRRIASRREAEGLDAALGDTMARRASRPLERLGRLFDIVPLHLRPGVRALTWPMIDAFVALAIGLYWVSTGRDQRAELPGSPIEVAGLIALFAFIGASVGVGAIHAAERQGAHHFRFALPTRPLRLLWQRLSMLACATVVLLVAAVLIGGSGTRRGLLEGFRQSGSNNYIASEYLFAGALVVLLSSMMLGILMRCFVRSYLLALLATIPLALVWTFVFAFASATFSESDTLALGMSFLWPALAALGVPLAALHLAVGGSPLLTVGEGQRALAMIPCLAFVLVWGVFLMTLSPTDLFVTLFN